MGTTGRRGPGDEENLNNKPVGNEGERLDAALIRPHHEATQEAPPALKQGTTSSFHWCKMSKHFRHLWNMYTVVT